MSDEIIHLWQFAGGEVLVGAPSQSRAIEIYEKATGDEFVSTVVSHNITGEGPQMTPSQLYGNIELALLCKPPGHIVWLNADDGYIHAFADADEWASHWPNEVVEFEAMWAAQ